MFLLLKWYFRLVLGVKLLFEEFGGVMFEGVLNCVFVCI